MSALGHLRVIQLGTIRVALAFGFAAAALGLGPVSAAPQTASADGSTPAGVVSVLEPDGTLNLPPGFHGSLDARGYRLISGPHEPPRFAPAAPGVTAATAVAGDEKWAAGFGPNGVDGEVYALAADETGDLFLGGRFRAAGGTLATNIVEWDGRDWYALGNGLDNAVRALAYDTAHDILYAGGDFKDLCGDPTCTTWSTVMNHVAAWFDGSWHALGHGLGSGPDFPWVNALVLDSNDDLYAGGYFAGICPDDWCGDVVTTTNYIAVWGGPLRGWGALGSGANVGTGSIVNALAWYPDGNASVLYVGGEFLSAAGTSIRANYVAAYTPYSGTWSPLVYNGMNGVDGNVYSLAADRADQTVYLGGYFKYVCPSNDCTGFKSTVVNHITRWDAWGQGWTDAQMAWGVNDDVNALAVDGSGNLYLGGPFTSLCGNAACSNGTPASHVVEWQLGEREGNWLTLGSGVDDQVVALLDFGSGVMVGGRFQAAGGSPAAAVAFCHASGWASLDSGNGLGDYVAAVAPDGQGGWYAGGAFRAAGGAIANRIAHWNGSTWSALGTGLFAEVDALAVDRLGRVYAAGKFSYFCPDGACTAHGANVNHIARWDPGARTWSTLGYGLDGPVLALAFDANGTLYAGGDFVHLCGNDDCTNTTAFPAVNHLARWSDVSQTWSGVTYGFDGSVHALAIDQANHLYAGGAFWRACADAACDPGLYLNRVAKWDGSQWLPLGHGLGTWFVDGVAALAVDANGVLYAGGAINSICGDDNCAVANSQSTNNLVEFVGGAWTPVGLGVNSMVHAFTLDGSNHLFVVGDFTGICDNNICSQVAWNYGVARWDGSSWSASALGHGLWPTVGFPWGRSLAWQFGQLGVGGDFYMAGSKVAAHFSLYQDNHPPVLATVVKTGSSAAPVAFIAADFASKLSDAEGESLAKIKVLSLPAHGTLKLGGAAVAVNQEIPAASLNSLVFVAAAGWFGATSFGWNGHDGNSYALQGATVTITLAGHLLYAPLIRR